MPSITKDYLEVCSSFSSHVQSFMKLSRAYHVRLQTEPLGGPQLGALGNLVSLFALASTTLVKSPHDSDRAVDARILRNSSPTGMLVHGTPQSCHSRQSMPLAAISGPKELLPNGLLFEHTSSSFDVMKNLV